MKELQRNARVFETIIHRKKQNRSQHLCTDILNILVHVKYKLKKMTT